MKKAVTLVEILLTIVLSALLMGVIIPFIRSMSSTLEIGSGKQEILQNSRAGLEVMTRYIRQARRITQIPAASGNYIKIRDSSDTFNIIFYHNISGSPYYIGSSGIIKDGDILMRSDQAGSVDSLLAPSAQSLTFNFLQDDTSPATKANQVKSVRIDLVLSDPLARISNTLALSDTVNLRQDVKILTATWFCHANQVGELSSDTWIDGFSSPNSVSVVPSDYSCWVADTGNSRIKKLSSSGSVLVDVTASTKQPRSVSVNSSTNECWVADTGKNRIKKLSSSGSVLVDVTAFTNQPQSVSVSSSTNECWVADTGNGKVVKLSSAGSIVWSATGFSYPQSVSVNSIRECWVVDNPDGTVNDKIIKLNSDGDREFEIGGFNNPLSVSAT